MSMYKFIKSFKIAALVLFMLFSSSLLYAQQSVKLTQKSDKKIKIIFKWFHQFQFAGYYAALEKGFYAQEGLDVELLERNKEKGYVESVLDGDADYGVADAGLLPYRLEGKPVVLVAQIFQHSPLVFLAKSSSGIISPYEMIGKTVMFDKVARSDASLQAMMFDTIGSLDKIKHIPHTFKSEDLFEDKVAVMAAYLSDQPYWFKEKGVGVNIINPQSYGVDFYGDNLFTTQDEVINNPDRVEKVRRATLRGWEYALAHQAEVIDIILKKYNAQNISKDRLEFEAAITERMILLDWVPIGTAEKERFEKVAKAYKRLGYIEDMNIPDNFIYQKNDFYGNETDKTGILSKLNNKEKAWLVENKVIKIATDPKWKPIEYRDSKGQMRGISVEYFNKISNILDVKFDFIDLDSWTQALDIVKRKELHVLSAVQKTEERSKYLRFTEPYLHFPLVIITRNDVAYVTGLEQLADKKVAVVDGYAIEEILRKQYPQIDLVLCRNAIDSLKKLQRQEVYASINNLAVASQYIQDFGYHNLKVSGETGIVSSLSMGVHKDHQMLIGILQKALDSINEKEKKEIFNKWLAVVYEYKFDYMLMMKVLLVIVIFVFIVGFWNFKLNQEIKRRTKQLRQANIDLALSNERYEQLAILSSDIVWELDKDLVFKYVSDRAVDIIGHDPDELVGSYALGFLDDIEEVKLKKHFEENIKGANKRVAYEYLVPKKDGSGYVTLEMFALPLYDKEDVFMGYRGISRDVTERRRSEEMLIQNEKMISVGSLAAGMAHEINNPLGAIMQGVQNVMRRLDKSFKKNHDIADEFNLDLEILDKYLGKRGIWDFLNGIQNSGERAARIVENMLQFSRKSTMQKQPTKLSELVDKTIELAENDYNLKNSYDFKYVEIIQDLADPNILINCVAVEIEQVLLNLFKNAAQALYEQEIEGLQPVIWIRSRNYDKIIEIDVEDNGPGMSYAVRRRIFEPFFTTKSVGKGTGIGLSVSYFIITEKHNGELLVDSILGKGTKFIIRLPLV